MKARVCIALIAGCLLAALGFPGTSSAAVQLQPIAGTYSSPDYVTSPPGDASRLFVVEQGGTIRLLENGVLQPAPFLTVPNLAPPSDPCSGCGERGLESMAFDPNFASNGLFYIDYTGTAAAGGGVGPDGDIYVDEYRASGDSVVPGSRRRVLRIARGTANGNHNGGQLQFGPDGFLYVSVGDATNGANAQSLNNLDGKILRIDPHGVGDDAHSSPASNPFAGATPGADEIWSFGLRNPFRFSFDHLTGDLVIGDVGQSTSEEVDFAPASSGLGRAANYGWPTCEGFSAPSCSASPFTPPVFAYPHPDPGGGQAFGCAIIGGYVYRGTQVPELAGRYVYADLCTSVLRSLKLGQPTASDDRGELAIGAGPHSFGEDASCNLYVAAGNTVSKIVSSSPPAVAPGCTHAVTATTKKKKKKCKNKRYRKHHKKKCKRKKHRKKHKRR